MPISAQQSRLAIGRANASRSLRSHMTGQSKMKLTSWDVFLFIFTSLLRVLLSGDGVIECVSRGSGGGGTVGELALSLFAAPRRKELLILAGDVETNPGPFTYYGQLFVSDLELVVEELRAVGEKWRLTGRALCVKVDDIMYPDSTDCLREVFRRKLNSDFITAWGTIIVALRRANEPQVADNLKAKYIPDLLVESDLDLLIQELSGVRQKWYKIGMDLELKDEVNDIRHHYSDPDVCLRKILRAQLQYTPLTWRNIADVLRSTDVGESQLADELETKYCPNLPSLSLLTQELAAVCEKWKYIGEKLGVEQSLLSHLDTNNSDPNYCLQLVLRNWLESCDTTWKDIVAVLNTRGIAESHLADNLEAKYCSIQSPKVIEQSVTTGSQTTFTIEATGDDLTFQWQKNDSNLKNDVNYSGTDTNTLSIQHVKSDEGHYRCLVKNEVNEDGEVSEEAKLTVFDPPKVTEHPKSQSVPTGEETTFRLEATGDDLKFQWQKNGSNLKNDVNYSGTDTNTLSIQHVKKSNEGHYRCLVKNEVKRDGEVSEEAKLTVCDPPKVTEHPKSQAVPTGGKTTLKVEASGDDLTFQWQKNGSNLKNDVNYSGTDTNTLSIQHVKKSDEGHYRCLVKNEVNEDGEVSEEAKLTVFDPPKVTEHPKSQSVPTGEETTFRLEATGDDLKFQWQKNGSNLKNDVNYSGTDTNTLSIQHVKKSDEGHYRCLVKNEVKRDGEVSEEAKLTVCDPPKVTEHPKSQAIPIGEETTFKVEASGDDLTFQWQKNGSNLKNDINYSGADTNTLTIRHVKKSHAGCYRCLVMNEVNKGGEISEEAKLTIFNPPKVTEHPKNQSVPTGEETTFKVEATGDDLKFQWQKNDNNLKSDSNCSGTSTNTLRIQNMKKSRADCYRCLVKNDVEKDGILSEEAQLSVYDRWKQLKVLCGIFIIVVLVIAVIGVWWWLPGNAAGSCHTISSKQELENAVAEIGNWEILCEHLGVHNAVLNALRNIIDTDGTIKKSRCLEAYLNMGNACWEQVVKVVADYPFYNFRLAKEIAATHGIDYLRIEL